jgi:hypothetical protein
MTVLFYFPPLNLRQKTTYGSPILIRYFGNSQTAKANNLREFCLIIIWERKVSCYLIPGVPLTMDLKLSIIV